LEYEFVGGKEAKTPLGEKRASLMLCFYLHVLPMDFPHLPERLKKFWKAAFLDGIGKPVSLKYASVMKVQIPPAPWVVCFAFAVLPGYISTHRGRRLRCIIGADNAHHVGDGVPFFPIPKFAPHFSLLYSLINPLLP
jgi:hypothetical protein